MARTKNDPTLEEWRKLYELASQVKQLAPWKWMKEADLFGVQNPETGELGFVSVMGMLGQHLAVAVYLGAQALYDFWEIQDRGPLGSPESILEVPELQASFEDRTQLHDRDRDVIRKLGLKFEGLNAWPQFRSYGDALFPWFLEAPEARFLAHVLEQVLDVAPRFRDNQQLLDPYEDERYLIRVPQREDDALVWKDQIIRVEEPEPAPILVQLSEPLVARLKKMERTSNVIEADFFMMHNPVRDRGPRPYFPYALLLVDSGGMVLGTRLVKPLPSLDAMWGSLPNELAAQLTALKMIPAEVQAQLPELLEVLAPLAEALEIKLTLVPWLPALEPAKASLTEHMDRF